MFYVYMVISKVKNRYISYVGYTNNLKQRVLLHNGSKGAKFTRGKFWKLAYSKKYSSRSEAMQNEFKLKKDRIKRNLIKFKFISSL